MSKISTKSDDLNIQRSLIDQKKSKRMPFVLGKIVSFSKDKEFNKGPFYYIPPWSDNQTESVFIYGPNRSGKTGLALNIALMTYYLEGRSWIFFDSKGSYSGVWKENNYLKNEIESFGLKPMGFPTIGKNGEKLLRIIEPNYYVNMLSPSEIKASHITDTYKIPIKFLSLQLMCDLTAINPGANYTRRYDDIRKRVYAEVPNPTIDDLMIMFDEIINQTKGNVKNLYLNMKYKILEEGTYSIQSTGSWSCIGNYLRESAMDGMPRFIVVTFRHSDSPFDQRNIACYTAILEELKSLSILSKRYQWNLKFGIMIDEMYYYTRSESITTKTSSWIATHDLLYNWGASNRILRVFISQRDLQLDKEFKDSIENRKISSSYTYDLVFYTKKIPNVGYASVLDRLHPVSAGSSTPKFYNNVKMCPCLCSLEDELLVPLKKNN